MPRHVLDPVVVRNAGTQAVAKRVDRTGECLAEVPLEPLPVGCCVSDGK